MAVAPMTAAFRLLEERETIGEIGESWRRDMGVWRADVAAMVTRRRFAADETDA